MNDLFKSFFLLVLIGLLACGDELDIQLPDYTPKLVVEGYIESGRFPHVYLTYSSGYYEPVDSAMLIDLVLATARVAVSDGETTEVLTLVRNSDIFPPLYYQGFDLRGQPGKTYELEITRLIRQEDNSVDTLRYYAETTIPEPILMDSIWFEYRPQSDSAGNVWVSFQDPPGQIDYYRVFTQLEGRERKYIPMYQSLLGDRYFDGELFEFPILKGTESISDVTNDLYFTKGDTVNVRFCTLDQQHFDFWRTLEREQYLTGNPFGSAGNEILTNIQSTEPVLGVWGGYGVHYKRFIVE